MAQVSTDDVFGVGRGVPLNYKERGSVDDVLVNSLTRGKHLVIYGSSKQGKTCLRKHCLQESDYWTVHCSNRWTIADLHTAILKAAGYEIAVSKTTSTSGSQKIFAKLKAGILGEGGAEASRSKTTSETTSELVLEPEDVNDIIKALEEFSRAYIVLEDFHYLPIDTQRDFSVALKAFHENSSLCFVIVGVWLEENRLSVYNGDLTGRVISINADKWEEFELLEVIASGESLLGIVFCNEFKSALVSQSAGSVYIVQEACNECCKENGIYQTQGAQRTHVGQNTNVSELVGRVVNQQSGRFNSFLLQFSDGFQTTKLAMPRWLLFCVLTSEISKLQTGLRQSEVRDILKQNHPEGKELNSGNVTQALQSVSTLQISKDIKPTILDYDQTNLRLHVVDRSFLIWLEKQDRNELLERIELPTR